MGSKTKKIRAAGRFGSGFGVNVRERLNSVEAKQRKKQKSPYHPKSRARRVAMGIWKCEKTGRVFAGPAYHLDSTK